MQSLAQCLTTGMLSWPDGAGGKQQKDLRDSLETKTCDWLNVKDKGYKRVNYGFGSGELADTETFGWDD